MPYSDVWDLATPAGTGFISEGDDAIREKMRALQERLATLTDFPTGDPLRLLAGVVATAAIADLAVTTPKLGNGAVTELKLGGLPASGMYEVKIINTIVTGIVMDANGYNSILILDVDILAGDALWIQRAYGISPNDKVLAIPMAFLGGINVRLFFLDGVTTTLSAETWKIHVMRKILAVV